MYFDRHGGNARQHVFMAIARRIDTYATNKRVTEISRQNDIVKYRFITGHLPNL